MSRYPRIPQAKREEILRRIKEDGETANGVAAEMGVSPTTVYNWLSKESANSGVSWSEYNRVRRENQQLKAIVGDLTLDLKRTKKR